MSKGRGGGQVVSMPSFYSDDTSLYQVELYSFFSVNLNFVRKEQK